MKLEMLTDASVAKGIASRRGLGKTRHVAVHYLWVQERVGCEDIVLKKILGGENPADLLIKTCHRSRVLRCLPIFCLRYLPGRAALAPAIAGAPTVISCMDPVSRW